MPDDSVLPTLALTGIGAVLLARLAKDVRDRYYKNQVVHVDGYTFTNCCFHNCTLITQTGAFAINGCTFAGCRMEFGPNAVRLIKLFHVNSPTVAFPGFNPQVALDGAVTIA